MSSTALWLAFRKFRRVDLGEAIASFLCLIFSIVISVYVANNWSSYDVGQRVFLLGLVALDFTSTILVYLMIVVKYAFWPDAVRTVVLITLHIAGAVTFTIYSPHFPCNAFGSAAHCRAFTKGVQAGLFVVSALLLAYGFCLLIMAFIPSPPTPQETEDALENGPSARAEHKGSAEEENRISHASSSNSQTWLLKNQESPELGLADLPVPPRLTGVPGGHSYTSSSTPSLRPSSPLVQELKPFESPQGQPYPAAQWSPARATRARSILTVDKNMGPSRSSPRSPMRQPPSGSWTPQSSPLPGRFGGDDGSTVSNNSYGSPNTDYEDSDTPVNLLAVPQRSSSESASASSLYSQSSAPSRSTSVATGAPSTIGHDNLRLPFPGQGSVHSMMASVHDHPDQVVDLRSPTSGAALPTPSLSSSFGTTTFQLHLSNPLRKQSVEVGDLPDIVGGRQHPHTRQDSMSTIMSVAIARPPHVRNDSTTSNVDMNEWRKLVMSAAGKD
ncbi:hypothetical protein BU15DRAFT_70313 [Melanogaster broomeanus]|nr:hypothetical protein BU15DRAFT_70313 [Melanogaster broomeanus]